MSTAKIEIQHLIPGEKTDEKTANMCAHRKFGKNSNKFCFQKKVKKHKKKSMKNTFSENLFYLENFFSETLCQKIFIFENLFWKIYLVKCILENLFSKKRGALIFC